ncbi:hypothetical protein Tsubulata_025666 [Turnera subulata]|uniref:HTH myb-type domain-containing protein n=1 Tax=Turnera subulata TaxID=218843 RepID=A0A9Q0GIA3_9ROSI|nr:hypothetical protein Tsubulata_025666 [Turnera subulata]
MDSSKIWLLVPINVSSITGEAKEFELKVRQIVGHHNDKKGACGDGIIISPTNSPTQEDSHPFSTKVVNSSRCDDTLSLQELRGDNSTQDCDIELGNKRVVTAITSFASFNSMEVGKTLEFGHELDLEVTRGRRGAWTDEEDKLLRLCIEQYGEGKLHLVPSTAGLNTGRKSYRQRWLNYLKPSFKRREFSVDEVDLMVRMHDLWAELEVKLIGVFDPGLREGT